MAAVASLTVPVDHSTASSTDYLQESSSCHYGVVEIGQVEVVVGWGGGFEIEGLWGWWGLLWWLRGLCSGGKASGGGGEASGGGGGVSRGG